MRAIWYRLVGIFRTRAAHRAAVARFQEMKAARLTRAARPPRAEARLAISAGAARLPPLEIGTIGDGGY